MFQLKSYQKIDLPPTDTTRWVKSRKIAVLKAIDIGQLTDENACTRYHLSPEELMSWRVMLKKFGPDALRATHLRQYRKELPSPSRAEAS